MANKSFWSLTTAYRNRLVNYFKQSGLTAEQNLAVAIVAHEMGPGAVREARGARPGVVQVPRDQRINVLISKFPRCAPDIELIANIEVKVQEGFSAQTPYRLLINDSSLHSVLVYTNDIGPSDDLLKLLIAKIPPTPRYQYSMWIMSRKKR